MPSHNDVVPLERTTQQPREKPENVKRAKTLVERSRASWQDLRRRGAVFEKRGLGADFALFNFFSREHWLRRRLILLVTHRYFDRFIVFAIVLNSVILALSDFSVVDTSLNPAARGYAFRDGVVVPATSVLNYIVNYSEIPFTSIFTAECLIKIVAMGFVRNKGAYLRESWNVLDFVVVISSLVAILPAVPNVSVIRTIRVLRPLRSLSMIPGMRTLISALLKALPALGNVVVLQVFLFFMFSILGNQLFGGSMTRRCRLTDFPVRLQVDELNPHGIWPVPDDYMAAVLANPAAYRCIDGPILEVDTSVYVKETSPWYKAQPCFWPVDANDMQICARPSFAGNHQCVSGETCGSNYDIYGNPRFQNHIVMEDALFFDALDYGFTTFDDIGHAFVSFFQVITSEGWTNIMYMSMDCTQPLIAATFYIAFVIFDTIFVMNLTLAVIADEFKIDDSPPRLTAAEKRALQLKAAEEQARFKPPVPWLYYLASHQLFGALIMAVIFANTAVLSLDHYPMSAAMNTDLEFINFVFACVFLAEMLIKVFGLGLKLYTRDRFNLFDAFVVIMGILEMALSPPSFMSKNQPKKRSVSALRSFRLFRVFKLARNWRSLRELLEMIGRAVAGIANFGVLLFIFIYIYALIGMQFFGNTMRFDDNGYPTPYNVHEYWFGTVPRMNFDTFLWSAITVFKIITCDNWNEDVYDVVRGNGMYSTLYLVSLIVFGNFIMMNLFLALLLDKFSTNDEEQEKEKEVEASKLARRMSSMSMKIAPNPFQHADYNEMDKNGHEDEDDDGGAFPRNQNGLENTSQGPPLLAAAQQLAHNAKSTRALNQLGAFVDAKYAESHSRLPVSNPNDKGPTIEEGFAYRLKGSSLFIFPAKSLVRRWALNLIVHPYFDSVVLAFVTASSIALAVDNPLLNPDSALAIGLKRVDLAFAIIFAAEMTVKIIALGLVMHKGSYLRNGWNILDCVIVITSLVMLIESSGAHHSLKSLRSLRTFRAFRPLRVISRRPGLKLVVNALIEAIPAVLNVLIVCALFYLIFSIFAVTYLKGKLNSCTGDPFNALSDAQVDFLTNPQPWSSLSIDQQQWFTNTTCLNFTSDSLTSKYMCGCWGGTWGPVVPENFDNVGSAMISFFEMSTTENWGLLMVACIDATDIDMQPIRDYNMWWGGFWIVFMMFGSFFVVNLFVGVIIENFNKMTDALGGAFMLTSEQKKWMKAQKAAAQVGPKLILRPFSNRLRRAVFFFVRHKRFEWFIMFCILINTMLMAMQHMGQSTMQTTIVNVLNEIFAAVFTLEAVLKITAYGIAYFEDNWNRFDFFVVVGTLSSIVVEIFTTAKLRSLAMLVRVFRVTRIIRLVKSSKGIRHILTTLYLALPGLSNVTSILVLMLFIYTTMGVQLFAKVALGDNIDMHANFQTFWTGFLLMIRAATGESWDYCMHDYASKPDGCVDDPSYDPTMCGFNNSDTCIPLNGCGNPIAYLFFCSFTLLGTYVMLNVTVAVILESFSVSNEDEEPLFDPELLGEFQAKWAVVDPKAKGFIPVSKLYAVFTILEPPLVKSDAMRDKNSFLNFVCNLRLPMYAGETIYFSDTMLAMAREMVIENAEEDVEGIGSITLPEEIMPSRQRLHYQAHEYFAARQIQRAVAAWLRFKRALEKQYMDEYKRKIKKPTERPKKQYGARVITTG